LCILRIPLAVMCRLCLSILFFSLVANNHGNSNVVAEQREAM
jgi:hypothetical protein